MHTGRHKHKLIMTHSEEGARFPQSVISSAVYAGAVPLESAWAIADVTNPSKTMKSELERIGFLGSTPCRFEDNPLAAHFELHIGESSHLAVSASP